MIPLTHLRPLFNSSTGGKMLLKLDTVHFVLGHHTAAEFPFLDVAANSRLRTTFYSTLCKLLFSDDQVCLPQRIPSFEINSKK